MSDKPGCGGWQYAQHHGIATEPFPSTAAGGADASAAAQALHVTLRNTHAIDYVVLAGFLKVRGAPCGKARAPLGPTGGQAHRSLPAWPSASCAWLSCYPVSWRCIYGVGETAM